jgi:hypothetical protein
VRTAPDSLSIPIAGPQTGTKTGVSTTTAVDVIRASDCSLKSYLENEDDIENYLAKLRDKLMSSIRAGKKVRIQ